MNVRISIFTVLACFALFLAGCSNDDEADIPGIQPPEVIIKAFNAKYPGITNVNWNVANGYYQADFVNDSTEVDAWFTYTAEWVMEEADLRVTLIPDEIVTAIQRGTYVGWSIEDASVLNRLGMGTVYKVEVQKNTQELDLYYSEYGNLIKTIEDTETNNDEPILIPSQVKSFMDLTFSGAILLDIINNGSGYTLAILDDTVYKTALLNQNYNWQNTTWEVSLQDVPSLIIGSFESSIYGGDQIESIYMYNDANGAFYKFNVLHNGQSVTLTFDVQGNLTDTLRTK